jgi:hypothetical protein
MPSKHDPSKDHSHYGEKTQEALLAFHDVWKSYSSMTWIQMRENAMRVDAVQAAWDRLVRARKEETGSGFYLNKDQYQEARKQ